MAVQKMATTPKADTMGTRSYVAIINIPDALRRQQGARQPPSKSLPHISTFVEQVRGHLREGRAVVINGWYPDTEYDFTVEDLSVLRPTMGQQVDWQGESTLLCDLLIY